MVKLADCIGRMIGGDGGEHVFFCNGQGEHGHPALGEEIFDNGCADVDAHRALDQRFTQDVGEERDGHGDDSHGDGGTEQSVLNSFEGQVQGATEGESRLCFNFEWGAHYPGKMKNCSGVLPVMQ